MTEERGAGAYGFVSKAAAGLRILYCTLMDSKPWIFPAKVAGIAFRSEEFWRENLHGGWATAIVLLFLFACRLLRAAANRFGGVRGDAEDSKPVVSKNEDSGIRAHSYNLSISAGVESSIQKFQQEDPGCSRVSYDIDLGDLGVILLLKPKYAGHFEVFESNLMPFGLISEIISDDDLRNLINNLEGKLEERERWEDVIEKRNNHMSYKARCSKPKDGPVKYLSVTIFENCTTELLRDFYMDNDYRKEWDKTVVDHKQLQVFEINGIEIGQTIKKFPLLTPREYVLAWRIWEGKDKTFYCFIKVVDVMTYEELLECPLMSDCLWLEYLISCSNDLVEESVHFTEDRRGEGTTFPPLFLILDRPIFPNVATYLIEESFEVGLYAASDNYQEESAKCQGQLRLAIDGEIGKLTKRATLNEKNIPGRDACEIAMVHQEDAGLNVEMAKLAFARGIWSYVCKMDNALRKYPPPHRLSRNPAKDALQLIRKVPPELEASTEDSTVIIEPPSSSPTVMGFGERKIFRKPSKKFIANSLLLLGGLVCLSRGRSSLAAKFAMACLLKKLTKREATSSPR
ncbi:hypothetical protein ACLOJK_030890 [Asimina triloba]